MIAQACAEPWVVPLILRVDVAALLPPGCRSGLCGVAHEQTEACRSDWQDDVARRPILCSAVGSSIRAGVLSSGTDERRNISLLREPGLASVTRPLA